MISQFPSSVETPSLFDSPSGSYYTIESSTTQSRVMEFLYLEKSSHFEMEMYFTPGLFPFPGKKWFPWSAVSIFLHFIISTPFNGNH